MSDEILIIGASGQQGRATIRHLLRQGQSVRGMTRHSDKAEDLRKMGVNVVFGDLKDRPSIDKALGGIKRMLLIVTPYEDGVDAETIEGINAAEAAAEAGIDYLVYSSVGSAQRHTGIPHFESKRKIELRIEELGITHSFIRPVFFMENLGSPWFLPALKSGLVSLPMRPDRKLAMVAVDNVGEYLANAFIEPDKFIDKGIELAGDELTIPDAMNMISRVTGKKINYQVMPYEDAEKAFGYDASMMYIWFDKVGYNPDIPMLEKTYNIRLIRFDEYLKTAPWVNELKAEVKVK